MKTGPRKKPNKNGRTATHLTVTINLIVAVISLVIALAKAYASYPLIWKLCEFFAHIWSLLT